MMDNLCENKFAEQAAGGTHMLRHTGMYCPNQLVFHQKSLDKGPILVKKIVILEEGHILPILQKKKE